MQKVIHLVGENVKVELDGELDEALSITLGKRASARVRVRRRSLCIHETLQNDDLRRCSFFAFTLRIHSSRCSL